MPGDRRTGGCSRAPERLRRLELQLARRQAEIADGTLIEQRDVAPRAGAAIPFDQQALGEDVLHGASQSGRRRTLYPAGAGYLKKKKPAVDREAEESTAGSVRRGRGPAG